MNLLTCLALLFLAISCAGLPSKVVEGGFREILREETKKVVHDEVVTMRGELNHIAFLVKTLRENSKILNGLIINMARDKGRRLDSLESRLLMLEKDFQKFQSRHGRRK